MEIPARISGDGSMHFGESYITPGHNIMRVEGDILIVYEERRYSDYSQELVEIGRFRLQRV